VDTGPFQRDLGTVCTQSSPVLLGILYLNGPLFSGTCPVSSPSASPYINLTNQVSGGHRIAVSSPRWQSASLHAHLFCVLPQWRAWRERRGDSRAFRAFHRLCWWRRFPTRGATASNLMTLAKVTDTGRRAVVAVRRQAMCLALCFCHCSTHGGTVSPNKPEKYCGHPYTDQCLTWVCEKQNKVQMDSLNSRADYGLKMLQRLYLHMVKNTSNLTATLGHQTQQPRLKVSDHNPDARHIVRVCTTPITEGSRVCAAATHLNQSQFLPHHRL